MNSLDLNLASRPFRNNTLLWVGYVSAFVLLAAFSAWNIAAYRDHVEKLGNLQGTVLTFDEQMRDFERRAIAADNTINQVDMKSLSTRSEKANQVLAWKAFSWTRLFNILETIQPWDVRMNSVRPIFRDVRADRSEGEANRSVTVAVEGTAKTFDDIAAFENVLHDDPHFGRVEPINFKRTKAGDLLFELRFLYDSGAGLELPEGGSGDEEVKEGKEGEAAGAATEAATATNVDVDEPPQPSREPLPPKPAIEDDRSEDALDQATGRPAPKEEPGNVEAGR